MKSIINKLFIASALTLSVSACSDFLNKEPLSQGTEAIVFKTPEHFEQAAYNLYDLYGWDYNAMDRNLDISGLGSNGGGTAPESSGAWGDPYGQIRKCNIILEKAEEYSGDKSVISHALGTAYFFRAWQYFKLLKRYGGVPIVERSLDLTSPELQAPRNSRYEVANFILNDLNTAIPLLTKEKDIADADKGKISKEAAQSFLARVALYEGTWEKYVPGIGFDLDGDGANTGAGTTKPEGYPSITSWLTTARDMSKAVIEEAETGTFQLWNECDSLSYYYLFNIDDTDGNIPNFKGKGKATNKEFIIYKKYDYNMGRPNKNISHTVIVGLATGISQQFGESFLCRNGLPIRISYTGDMANAQNNPEFEGYGTFVGEFRNRDYRFVGCCSSIPDRTTWSSRAEDGRQLTATGKPYPDSVYPQSDEVFNPSDPAYSSPGGVFRPTLRNNSTASGYASRKYLIEGANRPTNTESADYPNLRLAEVHCIYAEAVCELGGGNISDEDLNFSINKNRARARVAPLTNALIANVWDAGYWDYEQNKTVCKKMNMLDEIRRERACELFGEGHRLDDLKRWGIAHINLVGQKLGHYILGTAYETETANDNTYFGEPCYYPEKYPLRYGIYEGTGKNDPDYGRSISNDPTTLNYRQRDYLEAVPLDQLRLNTHLTQNPGW